MDDELESWCMRWLAKGELPTDLALLLRHWAEIIGYNLVGKVSNVR